MKQAEEIFKKAGKRSADQFEDLILNLGRTIQKYQYKNRAKNTIAQIAKSKFGNTDWQEDGIFYLSLKNFKRLVVVGDTHGDSWSTELIIKQSRVLEDNSAFLVFLGDYADRGQASLRNLEIIFNIKLLFPKKVILMKGNHEEGPGVWPYELPDDLREKFGEKKGDQLHNLLVKVFNKFSTLVVCKNGLVMVHGGIPFDEINSLKDLIDNEKLLKEMRWSDPTNNTEERLPSIRGLGLFLYGESAFERFMDKVGGQVMIRSHEYPKLGYQIFFMKRLITVFSNGGTSPESQYRGLVQPKYLDIDLAESIRQVKEEWIKLIDYEKI